jgi:AcrR family transcriptional regulator
MPASPPPEPPPARPPSRPGRKRSEASREAILAAALRLVDEAGFAGLTVEGIAARAGCGKQTVYRWWPSKFDVLFEAVAAKAELHVTIADHGSYAADLRAFLADSYRLAGHPHVAEALRGLMARAQVDEAFGERFRGAFLGRRREALRVVLDRAARRGDLPARPSPETVLDIVFGTLWYRVLATRQPLDEGLCEDLTAILAPGGGRRRH